MRCEKCKGLMVRERFADYFLIIYAWKCINCGAIVDSTITRNQKEPLLNSEWVFLHSLKITLEERP